MAAVALADAVFVAAALAVADTANDCSWPIPQVWSAAKLAVVETPAIDVLRMAAADIADNLSWLNW